MDGMKNSPQRFWELTRSGGAVLRGADFLQAAASTTGMFPDSTCVTYLVVKRDGTMSQFIVAPNESLPRAVASILGAEANEVDEVDRTMFAADHCAHLHLERGNIVTRTNISDPDPSLPSKALSQAMPDGSWIAVRTRHVTKRERKRQRAWLAYWLNTSVTQHPSIRGESVVVSVDVGSETRDDAKSLADLLSSTIPGFDYPARPVTVPVWPRVRSGLLLGILGALAIVFGTDFPYVWALGVLAAGVIGGAVSAAIASSRSGISPMQAMRLFSTPPPTFQGLVRKPRKGRNKVLPDGSIVEDEGRAGTYPLDPTTFMLSPDSVMPLVAPLAGASTGTTRTRERAVPTPITAQIGPYLGNGMRGAPVHLDEAQRWEGVLLLGKAGSGKSVTTHSLFAYDLMDRIHPSGRRGFPGKRHTMIAFENKGHDGAEEYLAWGRALGANGESEVHLVDLLDAGTPAIDVMGTGSALKRAQRFVDAMQYAFSDGSIAYRSAETLRQAVCAALAVTPEMREAAGVPLTASWLDCVHVLLGGHGDEMGVALAGEVRSEAVRLERKGQVSEDLSDAAAALAAMYASATPTQRRTLQEAPRNKVDQLLGVREWWSPGRAKITWEQILQSHSVVVVNAGTSMDGRVVSGELSAIMSAMLMYSLREAVQTTCSGWRSAGRTVTIYADELKLLAGATPDIITWLRDQGRSFGLRLVFATQYAEQLDPQVRMTVLGLSVLILFRQDNPEIAEQLATILAVTGEEWAASDIATLPPYHAAVRAAVGGEVQSPFTLTLRNFDAEKQQFPFIQTRPELQTMTPAAPVSRISSAPSTTALPSRPTVFGQEV